MDSTDSSVSNSVYALHNRLMSVTSRLEVLNEILGDAGNVPKELGAAALVFNETTKEAVQLWEDLEGWYIDHEHTHKAPKEAQS